MGPINVLLLAALLLAATPAAGMQAAGIARLQWMQGCWETSAGARTVEEHWMAPRGRSMLGMSRTVAGGSLVEHEFIVLREEGDRFAYEAHPARQPAAVFLSREVGDSMLLFENLEHDFPQRIGYRRDGPDTLVAWIEGTVNGKARRVDFAYRRVVCTP